MDGRDTAGQTTNKYPDRIFTVEGSRTLGRKAGGQLNRKSNQSTTKD